jgi:hypothetical protein
MATGLRQTVQITALYQRLEAPAPFGRGMNCAYRTDVLTPRSRQLFSLMAIESPPVCVGGDARFSRTWSGTTTPAR